MAEHPYYRCEWCGTDWELDAAWRPGDLDVCPSCGEGHVLRASAVWTVRRGPRPCTAEEVQQWLQRLKRIATHQPQHPCSGV